MKRRKFIMLTSAGAAVVVLPNLSSCNSNIEYDKSLSVPDSLSKIWDNEEILYYGNEYLINNPKEDNEQKLVKLLINKIPNQKEDITDSLNEKIKSDFSKGNTVMIDGWVLSRTEAQQCALFTLIQDN